MSENTSDNHSSTDSVSTPYDVKVNVKTMYIPDQSDPDTDRYVFAYTITIHNEGTVAAKL